MTFCQNCGMQLNEGVKFCPNCGTIVQSVDESRPAPVQQEINPVPTAAESVQTASTPVDVMEKEDASAVSSQNNPAQQPAYEQQAPQQLAYQQQAPQQPPYQQQIPQQPAYQQQILQQLAYQQQVPQQPAYQQQVYQQSEPQPWVYNQQAPRSRMYQQPVPQSQTTSAQPVYQQPGQNGNLNDEQMKKGMAVLAYFGFLCLIPIFAAKKDSFARYHANQGLVLFIFTMVCSILSNVLSNVLIQISPMLVLILSGIFGILTLVFFIFAIIGIVHAAKGQKKPLPIIGGIKILK
mgnify:CR=1 FL=1